MILKRFFTSSMLAAAVSIASSALAVDMKVGITPTLKKLEGTIDGKEVLIQRNQDQRATIAPAFAKTSRKCPPFCIQPIKLASGVETIGELELIKYVRKMTAGDKSILLVDSRTPDWVARGTIPGAINLPWTRLNPAKGADPISIAEIMTDRFGAKEIEGLWDYSNVKTLIMFCNGMWCGQSPNNIRNLVRFGYPANKIKWYRGGMQNWAILGLSVVKP